MKKQRKKIKSDKRCFLKCVYYVGVPGPRGPQDIPGPENPQWPQGKCTCQCQSMGQMITNGGMEIVNEDRSTSWIFTNIDGISSVNAQGRVHSGNFAVNIENEAGFSQTIAIPNGDYFYGLSFFAGAEDAQVSVTATVTFETPTGLVLGGTIIVNEQDIPNSNRDFGFYHLITTRVPDNATAITINFDVAANGNQSLDLDDVSLLVV